MRGVTGTPGGSRGSQVAGYLFVAIALGLLLRVGLALTAERQLDCDESTVALMALDILEHGARPMFFYGGSYNGGAAIEAYLGAVGIAFFGFSPVGFKLLMALMWSVGAALFADLCRRELDHTEALLAIAFLCLGTPFFLEWSLTARGGFAETFLFSALLLWLARPPDFLANRPASRAAAFGLVAGLALWASEMILPLLPFAAAWLLFGLPSAARVPALARASLGLAIGLVPLAAYDLSHDWQHLRESALGAVLLSAGPPLSLAQLGASLDFVLGRSAWLLAAGALIGALQIVRRRRSLDLAHVLLAHTVAYLVAYWISGARFLEIPPSRVLYPLQLDLALLLASALGPAFRAGGVARLAATAATLLWCGIASLSLASWMASGEARATGSWRASWCLVDAAGLRDALLRREVDVAFVNYWTATPLALANRIALRSDPTAKRVVPSTRWPERPRQGQRSAVALHDGSPLLAHIEGVLQRRTPPVRYERWHFGPYVVLSGLDATQLKPEAFGAESLIERDSLPPAPSAPDSFN
jgi:hypothetical protein